MSEQLSESEGIFEGGISANILDRIYANGTIYVYPELENPDTVRVVDLQYPRVHRPSKPGQGWSICAKRANERITAIIPNELVKAALTPKINW